MRCMMIPHPTPLERADDPVFSAQLTLLLSALVSFLFERGARSGSERRGDLCFECAGDSGLSAQVSWF